MRKPLLLLVLEEIEERRQFLSDMEALGKGKEHHNKITTEISQVKIPSMCVLNEDHNILLCRKYASWRLLTKTGQHNY